LIPGQVVPTNPASAVRGPKHVVKTGKTPVLEGQEWRRLIDTIPTDTARDLRDRALIATLSYGFARIGAALKMRVEDLQAKSLRVEDLQAKSSGWRIWLHEKGGKQHMMPCHHVLARRCMRTSPPRASARIGRDFCSARHAATAERCSDQPMAQADAWRMVRKRALTAGIMAPNMRNRWRRMKARARRSFMIAPRKGSRRMRSSGS
jgi:integrase